MSNSQPENILLVNGGGRIVSVDADRAKYLLEDSPMFLPNGRKTNKVVRKSESEKHYRVPTEKELAEYNKIQDANTKAIKKAVERKEKIKSAVDTLAEEIVIADVESKNVDDDTEDDDDAGEQVSEDLTKITGIGKATAAQLIAAGFNTKEKIKEALGEDDDNADLALLAIVKNYAGTIRESI